MTNDRESKSRTPSARMRQIMDSNDTEKEARENSRKKYQNVSTDENSATPGISKEPERTPAIIRRRNTKHSGKGNSVPPKPPKFGDNLVDRFRQNPFSCLAYISLAVLLAALFFAIGVVIVLGYQYVKIARSLPSVSDLSEKASQFETTKIYDRNGNLIYEIMDPNAGRRTYVKLADISPYVVAATITTEDKNFYTNPGFDPCGIIRALWQNYTAGGTVSGASTITQQLARTLLLSPEERSEITMQRKAREIVLAAEITRNYSKDEILELYLNEIFYGRLSYGIEAAAETYFNTSAGQLDLAQASFLAGLPQAPAVYDIFSNRDGTLLRHKDILALMVQVSQDANCIYVSNNNLPVCVSLNEAVSAAQEIEKYSFQQHMVNLPFPHWVNYIRMLLEEKYDAQTIYRSGFRVYTTIDPDLQNYAQQSVYQQVNSLADKHATDGALVAIRPQTGEVLAMVGSADFFNDSIAGQVNMALAPRQPGSSIKPLTYTAAFEKGWTPATLIWDVRSEFPPSGDPNDPRTPYKPVNYDSKFHGPVLVRTALASSFNIPAVKTLDFVGIYGDPKSPDTGGFINFAKKMGITTLNRNDYGLSLTLGGGDVTLLELTGAFSIFANNGNRVQPYAINRIEDFQGNVVFQQENAPANQVIKPEYAYIISNILSDNDARTLGFGANSVLRLPFPAAVKTGTTNDFRDNWTLGYTPDIAIGVWVGNADYSVMEHISGVAGAAPIWADVMQWAIQHYTGGRPSAFIQPAGIVDKVICAVSGTEPSENCPEEKREIFASDQLPLPKTDDIWQKVNLDTWTGLRASSACPDFTQEKLTLNVQDKWAVKWIQEDDAGKKWAKDMGFPDPVIFTPDRECTSQDSKPTIIFVGLVDDMSITHNPLDIYGVVTASSNFRGFSLSYGLGDNPESWNILMDSHDQFNEPTRLYSLDLGQVNSPRITLRIDVQKIDGTWVRKDVHLNILVPAYTPTSTPIPTETPLPTETLIPTETPIPTEPPIPTEAITPTLEPILSPIPP